LIPDFVGHCSSEIFPILPKEKLSRQFLFFWLFSPKTAKKINDTWTGARMPRANMKEVLGFHISLPSYEEQQLISDRLFELKRKIVEFKDSCRNYLLELDELQSSILQKAFSGELTSSREIIQQAESTI